MVFLALVRTNVTQRAQAAAAPGQAPTGFGYGPPDLQSAYDLPSATAGTGETVAVSKWFCCCCSFLVRLRLAAVPDEAGEYPYSPAEQAVIAEATGSEVVGDPATVIERLEQLVTATGADELMVTTSAFAHADRLASYELLAEQDSDT